MENIKKENMGLLFGIIGGMASIIFSLILYLGGVEWFVSPIAYLGFAIPIVFGVLAGIRAKKQHGGYLEYGQALKTVFLALIIMSVISTLFSYILFNFIDVPFREALAQRTAQVAAKMMERFGASQEDIDKAMANSMNQNNYSIGKMALGLAFSCIFWFIVSAIIAAIIKKKRPPFENALNQ